MCYDPRQNSDMHHRFREKAEDNRQVSSKLLTWEQIQRLFLDHPEYRLMDNPNIRQFLSIAQLNPDDTRIHEDLSQLINEQVAEIRYYDDPFLDSYPLKGSVIYPHDFISMGQMPTGDHVGLCIDQTRRNVVFAGHSGSGKTSALKQVLCNKSLLQSTCVVTFGKKRELRGLLTLSDIQGLVNVFRLGEFPLVFFMAPPGVEDSVWSNEITKVFAQCYGRISAQRLMNIKLCEMMEHRPPESYPTLSQLIEVLDNLKPRYGSKETLYKDSLLYCLNDLKACIGTASEYGSSNFMEVFFTTPGLKVIETETLPQEHLSFIAAFFMRWIYCKKLYHV